MKPELNHYTDENGKYCKRDIHCDIFKNSFIFGVYHKRSIQYSQIIVRYLFKYVKGCKENLNTVGNHFKRSQNNEQSQCSLMASTDVLQLTILKKFSVISI